MTPVPAPSSSSSPSTSAQSAPPASAHRFPSASAHRSPSTVASPSDLRRVLGFAGIALAVSIALSLPFAVGVLPAAAAGLVVPLAQLSPLVAALAVRRRDQPWWRALALGVPSWRMFAIAGLAAVTAFVVVPLGRVLLGLGAGVPLATDPVPLRALLLAVPAVLVMQCLFAIGEEAGWRGWLHGRLSPWGFWPSALLIGALWALWHAPIVLALGLAPRETVTYLGTIVAVAPLLGALREISGTAWAAVLGHGLLNSVRVGIEQNVLGPVGPGAAWLLDLASWALWLAAAWMVLRLGRGLLPARAGAA